MTDSLDDAGLLDRPKPQADVSSAGAVVEKSVNLMDLRVSDSSFIPNSPGVENGQYDLAKAALLQLVPKADHKVFQLYLLKEIENQKGNNTSLVEEALAATKDNLVERLSVTECARGHNHHTAQLDAKSKAARQAYGAGLEEAADEEIRKKYAEKLVERMMTRQRVRAKKRYEFLSSEQKQQCADIITVEPWTTQYAIASVAPQSQSR